MLLSVPVLVSVEKREIYELLLPGISHAVFRGPSLASLLDDAAIHLMETIPREAPSRMPAYETSAHVELRRVAVEVPIPVRGEKHPVIWKGRLAAVVSRWPEDAFFVACAPRLAHETFAVQSPAVLPEALARRAAAWAKERGLVTLDAHASRGHEHLEILHLDADLPSILPSNPAAAKKKKRKKPKPEAAPEPAEKKRVLVPPHALRTVGTNLTHRAIDGDLGRAYLRDRLADDIAAQLDKEGAAILLVGPSGAGKTALVHEVVRRLSARGTRLEDRRDVWQVDGNRIIAGMSVVGAWESRVGAMVHELSSRQDVLYVDDLPSLVYTGRSAHSDTNVAEYLTPHLARGDLRILGECTEERLLAVRDDSPGFFARFRVIQVPEMSEKDALLVLAHTVRELSMREEVVVRPDALETMLALVRRFEASRPHPGKAVSLLGRVLADRAEVSRDRLGRRVIDRERVVDHYGRHAGLPRFVLWEQEARSHAEVRAFFERRIVAQPNAVEAAADVVALLEQGLNDPARPISSFLFVGPTGVGKTETAKAIAELLFGAPERLIRFDMSELASPASVARLLGDRFAPDGELTRRVAMQPFSVILLDEIEKAHPAVFDALLQVLGEGRLTNAAGRTVDFTSTVVVMTSNLGVREAGHRLGFGAAEAGELEQHYRAAAERFFRPELTTASTGWCPSACSGAARWCRWRSGCSSRCSGGAGSGAAR